MVTQAPATDESNSCARDGQATGSAVLAAVALEGFGVCAPRQMVMAGWLKLVWRTRWHTCLVRRCRAFCRPAMTNAAHSLTSPHALTRSTVNTARGMPVALRVGHVNGGAPPERRKPRRCGAHRSRAGTTPPFTSAVPFVVSLNRSVLRTYNPKIHFVPACARAPRGPRILAGELSGSHTWLATSSTGSGCGAGLGQLLPRFVKGPVTWPSHAVLALPCDTDGARRLLRTEAWGRSRKRRVVRRLSLNLSGVRGTSTGTAGGPA
jgi:hypothetical protein